jgi:hypothetical protein
MAAPPHITKPFRLSQKLVFVISKLAFPPWIGPSTLVQVQQIHCLAQCLNVFELSVDCPVLGVRE